jgi:GNAT superfamily N-acetyltransferase
MRSCPLNGIVSRAMENILALPDSRSPDLYLTHPTTREFESIYSLSFLAWADALTLPQYLEESALMTTVPLASNGGMSVWLLTDKSLPQDQRPILCSCETFRKRTFVMNACGDFSEAIVHGVASVFCNPEYRRRGYAARLMRELAAKLPTWQVESKTCIGSVLYSDIGKSYYAKLGWHPFPLNNHIEFDAMHVPNLSQSGIREIIDKDLEQYCKDDEAMIRKKMIRSSSQKARMMIVPDLDHMLWHHRKEEFACDKLFGKQPDVKGSVIGDDDDRIWMIWTHRYYGNPEHASSDNTLYILRLVIENENASPEQVHNQVQQMQRMIQAAQNEAAGWDLHSVKLWDPAHLVQDLVERTGIQHRTVQREEESIASLLWFGEGSGKEDTLEWLGNEKYGWC